MNSNLKWCPKTDCGKTITKPRWCSCTNRTRCECGIDVCFKCGKEWHGGRCTSDGDAAFKVYGMMHAIAKCPKCKAPCEKIDGCNKMTCSRCNTYFCWLCREKLDGNNPYYHYEDPFSGCFGNGVSCGGCYLGILLVQLIVFALTPIILHVLLLHRLIKKTDLKLLYYPTIDALEDKEEFFIAGLLVGSLTLVFMIPVVIIATVPAWAV